VQLVCRACPLLCWRILLIVWISRQVKLQRQLLDGQMAFTEAEILSFGSSYMGIEPAAFQVARSLLDGDGRLLVRGSALRCCLLRGLTCYEFESRKHSAGGRLRRLLLLRRSCDRLV
jgi:hypothetical protein